MAENKQYKCEDSDKVFAQTVFVTWIGLVVNIFLALLKFILGVWGKSAALVTDSVHSLSDTVTDFVVLFGARYWTAPADENHPYGHGRIENILSGFIGAVLTTIGIVIGYNAIVSLISGVFFAPHPIGLVIAVASVVSKEILYRWTYVTGKRLKSKALVANALHHRSDSFSSIAVVIALFACMVFGDEWAFLDMAGALVVSVFIIYAGISIMREAFDVLSDKSVPIEMVNQILEISLKIDDVIDVHALRTRMLGGSVFVDMHIVVSKDLTVYQGHNISGCVKRELKEKIGDIVDVVVHIEPNL